MSRRIHTIDDARQSLAKRLQKRSVVKPNGCAEWTGHTTHGYGYVNFWNGAEAKILRAHRAAYALHHGLPIQFDGVIRHTCDNTRCINPAHLQLGTQADNMADKVAKNRQQKGERVPNAKLDAQQVRAIRADSRIGKLIAPEYGISHRTVWDIKARRIWKHVA